MASYIDATGLNIDDLTTIVADLEAGLKNIYGTDINIDQNSPDGQLINIFAQSTIDLLELLLSIYNSFDPDLAYGTTLDQRVAINGVYRTGATYTYTPISITTNQALNLIGLDGLTTPAGDEFIVSDGAGTQFILLTSETIATAGVYSLNFRAFNVGKIETVLNTITNQTTIIVGITAVNNPLTYTSIGQDGETDSELKLRRLKSFMLSATAPADSVLAAVSAVADVTDSYVAENNEAITVGSMVAHSIWVIVEGGLDADIAQAIYSKKNAGCAMNGGESVVVDRPNGNTSIILFDRPTYDDLYIHFSLTPRRAGIVFDETYIKDNLVKALNYKLYQTVVAGEIIIALNTIAPDGVASDIEVSDDGMTWVQTLTPTTEQHKFIIDSARINIL